MASTDPEVLIRMGTHAEKQYIQKTLGFFDGLVIAANLVESTPGATASLLVKVSGKRMRKAFYLDPMTYAFGSYQDGGVLRTDLDWIKSDQKRKGKIVRDFKRSYAKLAREYGGPVLAAIERNRSLDPSALKDDTAAAEFCRTVAEYQMGRLAREFREDEEYALYADQLPIPTAIFAPYFYMEPSKWSQWLSLNLRLARLAVGLELPVPVHSVVLADSDCLDNPTRLTEIADGFRSTGVKGVWLWFSRFDEHTAKTERLSNFRAIVENLADSGVKVLNMHGGYFSLALSRHGLAGISHGVGYGEQKDVIPIIGQSTPTVRYYLPALAKRLGVPEVQRAFEPLGITKPEHFFEKVCDCAVCKGTLTKSTDDFAAFGEKHYARPDSKQESQTPAGAKLCRFHFLLNRIKERDYVRTCSPADIVNALEEASETWGGFEWLRDQVKHLMAWKDALA